MLEEPNPQTPYLKHTIAIQFHPEVSHTPRGTEILKNFVCGICQADASWTMESFVDKEIDRIRGIVGPTAQVIGAVSGGVDSTVAARLMTLAIGDRWDTVGGMAGNKTLVGAAKPAVTSSHTHI